MEKETKTTIKKVGAFLLAALLITAIAFAIYKFTGAIIPLAIVLGVWASIAALIIVASIISLLHYSSE